MLADVLVKHVSYPTLFYIGSAPMFLSFFAVTLLSHWEEWDPVSQVVYWMLGFCRSRKQIVRSREDGELSESLIDSSAVDTLEA